MRDKVILVDCDGVLLDWEYAFHRWMQENGFEMVENGHLHYSTWLRYGLENHKQGFDLVRLFNNSSTILNLPPFKDAVEYVTKLHHEHGYKFHCITSLSKDPNSGFLRTRNLHNLFGVSVFDRIKYLNTGEDKDHVLEQYKGSGYWWVEDKTENALVGQKLGLRSLLMKHTHNHDDDRNGIPSVYNWKEIYEEILLNDSFVKEAV